jgi:nucleotide-binding universal stress UspA family protein
VKTLLVPLDGSELGSRVLPYVRTLAANFSARVQLLYVTAARLNGKHAPYNGEMALNDAADMLRADGFDVATRIESGTPALCIVEAAADDDDTLVVMATHGYSGIRRWTLGSVTEQVIHTTRRPVFVVHGAASPPVTNPPSLKHLLLPLDGSSFARQALALATELATHAQATLHLLHAHLPVSAYPPLARASLSDERFTDLLADQRRSVAQEIESTASNLQQQSLAASTCIKNGHPAEVITAEAARRHCDAIVMATHGYSGIQRWALGSVANRVLHTTPVPLVLVHATE